MFQITAGPKLMTFGAFTRAGATFVLPMGPFALSNKRSILTPLVSFHRVTGVRSLVAISIRKEAPDAIRLLMNLHHIPLDRCEPMLCRDAGEERVSQRVGCAEFCDTDANCLLATPSGAACRR